MTAVNRLVLLHGFTQTGRSWRHLRDRLTGFEVVTPDLPGHGSKADGCVDLWKAAATVAEECGDGIYVGYSLGARVALHCALSAPRRPVGLVLISGTAGIDDAGERKARRESDESLARHLETIGLEAFLREWLAQPLFAGLDPAAADIESRLHNSEHGLAASLRNCGTGTQDPLWDRLGSIDIPVLTVAGEHDAKFRALAERLAAAIPGSTTATVPGCGHSVPFEAPDATATLLRDWIASVGPFPPR